MKRLSIMAGMALALVAATSANAAEGGKSVFSDAAVWIKGAYDRNTTVGIDGADLRHALDASATLSNYGTWGADTNCVLRYEDVPCPYAGTVMSNVPCFYMTQCIGEDGTMHPRHFRLSGNVCVTDCVGTVVMRIRPDQLFNTWVCGGIGFIVGFSKNDAGTLTLRGNCGNWQTTNLKVAPGTWMDLAVVSTATGNGLSFYAVTNNGALWTQNMSATGIAAGEKKEFFLGLHQSGYSSWNPVATNGTSARLQAFRGSIHSIAVWNRRLSEAEIREAFAYPRTDVMRIGLADGASGEFIKASPDGKPVNSGDWYGMPAALAPGESVDIAFWLKDYEHTFPQVLRLTSAPGSSGGLDVSVNGTALRKALRSAPGATKTLFIPGELFLSGSNTLHLANNSSGTVRFDALALGGSWQRGVQDDSSAEFCPTYGKWQGYAEDGTPNAYPYRIVEMGCTNSVVAIVPEELATSGHPATFNVRAFVPGNMAYYDNKKVERPRWKLLVNGVVKGAGQFSEQYQTLTAKLEPGEINAGTNVLAIANENTSELNANAWFNTDCWRLEIKDFPKGINISFK